MEIPREKTKRRISPPREMRSVEYVLFFLPEENKYVQLSTASTLFPKNLNLKSISPLEEILLKDSFSTFSGLYVCHSSSESEVEIKRVRLQHFIDSGKHLNSESSLKFLNESLRDDSSSQEILPSIETSYTLHNTSSFSELSEVMIESHTVTNETSDREASTLPENVTEKVLEFLTVSQKSSTVLVVEQKKTNDILSQLLTETKKVKKALKQSSKKEPVEVRENVEPVMFNDLDLTKIGNKNLDLTNCALKIARTLWTDDELRCSRLFPKREIGDKKPLSPTRSNLFKSTLKRRFQISNEDLDPAVLTVNQLCADIKAGKRRRSNRLSSD